MTPENPSRTRQIHLEARIYAALATQSVAVAAALPSAVRTHTTDRPQQVSPSFSMSAIELTGNGSSDVLLPFRQRLEDSRFIDSLDVWLPIPRVATANPASRPDSRLYEQFVGECSRNPELRVSLVFHGTPRENIPSICAVGK